MNPRTGRAVSDADPGNDGELPAPVHAYAAAGHRAPRFVYTHEGIPQIECPRCRTVGRVTANSCPSCGVPFTMEGTTALSSEAGTGLGVGAAWMGILGIPMSACGFIGVVPGLLAIALGLAAITRHGGSRSAIAGIILGLIAIALAVAVIA